MVERSSFFNSADGDREYTADDFAEYFRQFLTTGVYHRNRVPGLEVKHHQLLQTKVLPGAAYIEGYMYINDSDLILQHDTADVTNPRIDRVVIRLDLSINNRYARTFVKKGTPATNPQPPVLTRNNSVYEISLAQVRINAGAGTVTNITDERKNKQVCGLVASLIDAARITVSSTAPVNPEVDDIWIQK